MQYWHNPRCAKSREALALLHKKGLQPSIREYLKDVPDTEELSKLVIRLGLASARELMRTKDATYKALGLSAVSDEAALIKAMAEHPRLIERPILIINDRAVIGRPPEDILNIL